MSSTTEVRDIREDCARQLDEYEDRFWKMHRRIARLEDFIRNGANAINVGMDDPFEAAIQQTLTDSFADGR